MVSWSLLPAEDGKRGEQLSFSLSFRTSDPILLCSVLMMVKMEEEKDWKRKELMFLLLYAFAFYDFIVHRSLQLSQDQKSNLYGLRPGWLWLLPPPRLNDENDAQWTNFRANLPLLSRVFTAFALLANFSRAVFSFKAKRMSFLWLFISLSSLSYLLVLAFYLSSPLLFLTFFLSRYLHEQSTSPCP